MNTNQKKYTDEEKKNIVTQFNQLHPTLGKIKAAKQLGVSPLSIANWTKKNTATKTKKMANKKAVLTSPVTSNTGNEKMLVILGERTSVQEMFKLAIEKMN